ncbi:MAG: DEAD/DEAH box helicase, partial [Synechococcales cyanobacterium]
MNQISHGGDQGTEDQLIQPTPVEDVPWTTVQQMFQQIWGYEHFRPPQGEIIHSILSQKDTLIVMPTGGGKSICFQLPALLHHGLTLVVSPLVALMENQVQELRQQRLPVAALHSQLTSGDRQRVIADLDNHRLRLLYLSPETLLTPSVWDRICRADLHMNGIILDEAHC